MKGKFNFYKLLTFVLLVLIIIVAQMKFKILPSSCPASLSISNFLSNLMPDFSRERVIAIVNGEKILESEFNATYNSLMFANPGITKSDVLELLVEQKVLVSKAKSLGITINDSEYQFYLQQYIDQLGGEEEFKKTLDSLGLNRKVFENLLKEQIYIQKLFEQYYFNQVQIDDEEVNQFIEQYFGSEDAVNESVKESIKEALLAQKRIDFVQQKVDELKAEADVKILVDITDNNLDQEENLDLDTVIAPDSDSEEEQELNNAVETTTVTEEQIVQEDTVNEPEVNAADLKACVEKKIAKDVDFFVICDQCDSFESFFQGRTDKVYIGTPDDTTISLIKECLSEVYQGYIPEVICLNNGQSITENFDSELEQFFNACV